MDAATHVFVHVAAEIAESRRQIAVHTASIDDTVMRTRALISECRDLMTRVERQLRHESGPRNASK